jgi:acetylornithine/N-succinyldiaminopimelate aminotransferase
MTTRFSIAGALGPTGPGIAAAMRAGERFFNKRDTAHLLAQVGRTIAQIPACSPIDKSALPNGYGGNQRGSGDDFLAGRGLFYLTEQRRLFLDCTSGHYQMLWGYNHPALCQALDAARQGGIIWDNHSNIPQAPLKWLAHRLVALGNAPAEPDPLDTVLLGVCTGSVACAAALKIQLRAFERTHRRRTVPVVVVLEGNYHGTDVAAQFLRGLWPGWPRPFEVVSLPPNEPAALERAFRRHGRRMAGFWAEPVMMNCEALALDPDYLRLAQQWCRKCGALFCVDEIQTGFWQPEVFQYRALGLQPDLVVLGKGMTAGFHPLSGVLFRRRHDVLEQYDAISTNGSAALPAFVALCSLEMIQAHAARLRKTGRRIEQGFKMLAAEFPQTLERAQGRAHLSGLKFRRVEEARRFHRQLLEAGLWTRVHAYHEGHRTILTKLGLLADERVVDFVLDRLRRLLQKQAVSK